MEEDINIIVNKIKEKTKEKSDAPQGGERMMGFFVSLRNIHHPFQDKKVRHSIRKVVVDLLYL